MLGRDSSFMGFLWRVRWAGLPGTSWRTSLGLIFCIGLREAAWLSGVLSHCWWSFLSHGLLTYFCFGLSVFLFNWRFGTVCFSTHPFGPLWLGFPGRLFAGQRVCCVNGRRPTFVLHMLRHRINAFAF